MAYDNRLAARIREILAGLDDVSERKMFGGIAFLVSGHMCVGLVGSDLMVRVGKDGFDKAVSAPHARPMDFTGKPSTGMVYVAPPGVKTIANLRKWIDRALSFTETLPPRVAAPSEATRGARVGASRKLARPTGRRR